MTAATGTLFVDHRGGYRVCPPDRQSRPRSGIHVALHHAADVLLVRPPDADWFELPGGGLETDESPLEAIRRELLEEAGVELTDSAIEQGREVRLATRYYASNRDEFWEYDQRFRAIALAVRPNLEPPLEPGHERVWVPIAEINTRNMHHIHRIALDRLLGLWRAAD